MSDTNGEATVEIVELPTAESEPVEQPVVPRKPRRERLTVGQEIIEFFDAMGAQLPEAERAQIIAIIDKEGMNNLIESNLGELVKANKKEAAKVFHGLLLPKIEIPDMLMTYRFYTLWSAMKCVEYAKGILFGCEEFPKPTYKEKTDAISAFTEAVKAMDRMVGSAQKLAETIGAVRPQKPAKQPKNKPPE